MSAAKTSPADEKAPAKKPDHVFLIDGSGYIFRAFHALPPLTRPDGTPVNAVLGFTNMLLKLVSDTDAEYIAVLFDTARKNYRNDIFPDYKAHRPPPPPELIPQFALIREATKACNVPQLEMEGFEADDLIATYARQAAEAGAQVTIVSSDKDLMQLIGPQVSMLDPIKNRPIGPAEVEEKFGVGPDKVVEVQALAGDSSDNVPGVPGIGVKTAAELIKTYGSLEELLARAGEIKQPKRREALQQNAELARISRRLVLLKNDVPVKQPFTAFARREPDAALLIPFLEENQFRSVLARVQGQFAKKSAGDAAVADGSGKGHAAAKQAAASAKPTGEAAYELVMTEAELARWVAAAREKGAVAFDTETTSIDPMQASLVGFSLAIETGRACYVPVGHRGGPPQGQLDLGGDGEGGLLPNQIPLAKALALIKPLLEDPSVLKIGQNIKYDMTIMAAHDIAIAPYDDTMLISYVLAGGAHGHGMDELSELHLNHRTIHYEEVAGTGKAQVTFDRVPLDKALAYAAEDADVTLRLHQVLKPQMLAERLATVYETIDRPLVPVVMAMERAGVRLDRKVLQDLSADFAARLIELEKQIHKLAGHEFNIGSPKQLGEVMFDEMGLGGGKKGKTGAYATGADVLEELAAQGHDLPARVLDWRQLSKLKSTYTDSLQEQINARTGRVHTSFALAATSTGRLSSTDPNLQNIPIRTEEGRKIRRAFVAEKGWVLLSVDYSQIELRLAAHMAEVPQLKEAFREGIDIHAMTASQVFGVPVKGMDPMVRRRAKAINFGIIYGISAFGLAAQLGIPQGEARAYIDAYFKRYPEILGYMDRTKKFARDHGYVLTLFGRRCHVPGILDKNPARRSFMERAAINAPLQGTAADIIKRAMIRVPAALADAKLQARMLLQVHDELLFEVPKAEAKDTAALVKKVMERACAPALELDVPLVAETGTADNWADAH
ncbi:DNA polymerase I [Hypericibacter terrae]|uniref:DNA polymerase I n=1 Tax=Hypericibacter terrae TaxID=2602015 RepID=A0A5J6MCX1_9PROT|nr:DNA polymerase I [Hypericibacter terrae]QEX14861.1 DNA polymerase I [Hypericibacter terrae]